MMTLLASTADAAARDWPYVIGAYALTWAALGGYALFLYLKRPTSGGPE